MANPAVVTDFYGNATAFYAGDLSGQLWKFNFANGINATYAGEAVKVKNSKKQPLAIFKDDTTLIAKAQPITTMPLVFENMRKGRMVMIGTGKYMEKKDADSSTGSQQTLYGIWDDGTNDDRNFAVTRDKLQERVFDANGKTDNTLLTLGNGTGQKRGWAVNLKESKELVATEGALGPIYAVFNSVRPTLDDCASGGTGASMTVDPAQGTSTRYFHESFPGVPAFVYWDASVGKYSFSTRSSSGKRTFKLGSGFFSNTSDNQVLAEETTEMSVGRVGWREIRQFLD